MREAKDKGKQYREQERQVFGAAYKMTCGFKEGGKRAQNRAIEVRRRMAAIKPGFRGQPPRIEHVRYEFEKLVYGSSRFNRKRRGDKYV